MTTSQLRLFQFVAPGALTIAAFATGGYYLMPHSSQTPDSRNVEWALSWGSLGAAIVASAGVALILIRRVRARQLSRASSFTIFTVVSIISIFLPPALMLSLRDFFGQYLFYGDSGLALPMMSGFMLLASTIMLIGFNVYVHRRIH